MDLQTAEPETCVGTDSKTIKEVFNIVTALIDLLEVNGLITSEEFNAAYRNVLSCGTGEIRPRVESLRKILQQETIYNLHSNNLLHG